MSQRSSGYARLAGENYCTIEAWPVRALLAELPIVTAWDPCPGDGALLKTLQQCGVLAVGTERDFFELTEPPLYSTDGIIMNPPYGPARRGELAQRFLEHALTLPVRHVAALLPIDFDSAITRQHLFRQCPTFAGKLVLLGRLRWIPNSTGSPSSNHAWYLFDRTNDEGPSIRYACKHEV
jgi:hypothetical protein